MSLNTRTSLDKTSEILMPAALSDVPRKLEALRKRQKFYADRQTQPSQVFAKGDKVLVEEREVEWNFGTVKEFSDNPRSLLVQHDTTNRVYRRNTKPVKKTNTTVKRKAQKHMVFIKIWDVARKKCRTVVKHHCEGFELNYYRFWKSSWYSNFGLEIFFGMF
jgi:hypothetical protein